MVTTTDAAAPTCPQCGRETHQVLPVGHESDTAAGCVTCWPGLMTTDPEPEPGTP